MPAPPSTGAPAYPRAVSRRETTTLAGEGLVYGIAVAAQRGLPFLLLPAASRLLDSDELGAAVVAMAVAAVLATVFGLGVGLGIVRLYSDEPSGAPSTTWAALLQAQFLAAAALAALAWASGPWWSGAFAELGWSGPLQAAVVLGLASSCQTTTLGALRAARRARAFGACVAIQVVAGGALALVLADDRGPGGFVAGLALGSALAAAAGFVFVGTPARWSTAALRAGFALSLPFVVHLLAGWVLTLSDRLLVERYLDLTAVARYQVAYAIASVPALVADAAQMAWVPAYYGMDGDRKRGLAPRLALPATAVLAALAVATVLVAPLVARLLAPADLDVPITVVALVAAAGVARVPFLLAFAVVTDAKDTRSVARASVVAAVVNVAANVVLIPVWGLTAAAATTLVAYTLMSAVLVLRAEAVEGIVWPRLALAGGTAALAAVAVGLAQLPDGVGGWTVRVVLIVPAVLAGRAAVQACLSEGRAPAVQP